VQKNRAIALSSLSPHLEKMAVLKQVHSATVHIIDNESHLPLPATLQGDALVTDQPNIALGTLTADCAPVLFSGQKSDGNTIIAAAHAGWGGAVKGILGNTIETMINLGAKPSSITAAIGPCIAQASYEVDVDFMGPFLNDDPLTQQFFMPAAGNDQKAYFDLKQYCRYQLMKSGLSTESVFVSPLDTCADKHAYFSHRRATHEKAAEKEGRQIALIYI
jgi:YfiH family protein